MPEPDDHPLLQEFAHSGSEAAFAVLVDRYVNLVYSTALRSIGNPSDAGEITQAVFIILARKAGKLSSRTILSGWLYQTTRLTAANFKKGEGRRQRREQEAYMQSTLNEPDPAAWEQLAPLLDEAMGRLGETDRTAIVLHYFEKKTAAEVAAALQITEAAVYKRTHRALEKLKKYFTKRGVDSTAAGIVEAISTHSIQAAPLALAKSVTAVAILKGVSASVSCLSLVKTTINFMKWFPLKISVAAAGLALLITGIIATDTGWFWHSAIPPVSFQAEGTLTYEFGSPLYPNSYKETRHFIIMREGNLWKIRTTVLHSERNETNLPPTIILYDEMGFDGANIYTLEQQDDARARASLPAKDVQSGNYLSASGRVQPSISPPGMDIYLIFPVWLAYCSSPYFNNLNTDKAVSPEYGGADFLDSPAKRMELPAKWTMNDGHFLHDISWTHDGTYGGTQPDGTRFTGKYPPPYDQGYVRARFEIVSWTNWDGITLPASFKLVEYSPFSLSKTNATLMIAATYTGSLDKIQKLDNFSPIPALSTRTYITDWRLKDPHRFHEAYISTNQWNVLYDIH